MSGEGKSKQICFYCSKSESNIIVKNKKSSFPHKKKSFFPVRCGHSQAGGESFSGFPPAVLSYSFMGHRMGALNARAFLEKLVTHVLIMRKTSNGLLKKSGLSSEDNRNPAFDYVSPVRFFDCMCTIAFFELRWLFELNRVMQSDTKLLSGP